MSIYDTPENYLSNFDQKSDMRKVLPSLVHSSSTLFSCSIRTMYNRAHSTKNKCLVFKSYLPGINTSAFPKRHYDNIFSENYSIHYIPG